MGRQKWGIPEYSKTQVDKAGKSLSKTSKQDKILDDAISIINNWRAAHAYPLHVVYVHLRKMAGRSSKKPVVAERLKRLDSIVNKLMRHEGMMLSRMQDIDLLEKVKGLVEKFWQQGVKVFEDCRVSAKS